MPVANAADDIAQKQKQGSKLPWVVLNAAEPGKLRAPYFMTDDGRSWTPIGQNDAITWPELNGLFRRRDVKTAERYLDTLAAHGVTVLRLMMEYSQFDSRCFEKPVGFFQPSMVRLWDDIFEMCDERGLRILLTPFDTFWMWINWSRHPYNRANGGPCERRSSILLCPDTRKRIKDRLAFAAERWGASGALFAWDLWNEIHPSCAENSAECFADFIADLSEHVRNLELRRYGRSHPQTVSMFGPHLALDSRIPDAIFRHPLLDFASTHFYEEGAIDFPENTVEAALAVGRLIRGALRETAPDRPFFDSESGPIHTFKDHHITLPEAFDDEYFRHMQWAHFAGGGAGGGMRWPNRNPHSLTPGMRLAQRSLARFLPFIDWRSYRRRNLNDEVGVSNPNVRAVASGDDSQALLWMVRTDATREDGMLRRDVSPARVELEIPGLKPADYRVVYWNTVDGEPAAEVDVSHAGDRLKIEAEVAGDLAIAITAKASATADRD
jgi:mannan endo-1,4-beta-mannosidase